MADALCGPSNALQNFQKHASTDRTLQQDRLTSRQGPSQSFRSPQSNVGLLDPEFEAFQAGHAPGPVFQENQHFNPHFQSHTPFQAPQAPALNAGWANDFQKLHISTPPPQQSHRFQTGPARQAPASTSSWHQDFAREQNASGQQQSYSSPMFGQSYGGPQLQNYNSFAYNQDQSMSGKGKAAETVPAFDEAAFERAFELAHASMLSEEDTATLSSHDQAAHEALDIATQQHEATPELKEQNILPEQPAVTQYDHLALYHEEAATDTSDTQRDVAPHDDEELAQTAGRLLESVADNTSAKFQQSSFLALMRKLRDHEMRVEGDRMVEVTTPPDAHPRPISPERLRGGPDRGYDRAGSHATGAHAARMNDSTDTAMEIDTNNDGDMERDSFVPNLDPESDVYFHAWENWLRSLHAAQAQ